MSRDKPIAYATGSATYHPDCWFAHADEYFMERNARAWLGTIYYPGAEKGEIKGVKCARCGVGFTEKGGVK